MGCYKREARTREVVANIIAAYHHPNPESRERLMGHAPNGAPQIRDKPDRREREEKRQVTKRAVQAGGQQVELAGVDLGLQEVGEAPPQPDPTRSQSLVAEEALSNPGPPEARSKNNQAACMTARSTAPDRRRLSIAAPAASS